MNKSLAVTITALMFVAVSITSLYAGKITYDGSAPKTGNTVIDNELDNVFNGLISQAESNLGQIGDMPDFVKSMAAANAHASGAATQRHFVNYNLIAITVGSMFSSVGEPTGIANSLTQKGDLEAGVGMQAWALQVGINAGFLLDGLYLAFKYGQTSTTKFMFTNNFQVATQTFGLLANYELIEGASLLIGWRGLSLGSGVIYQKNDLDFTFKAKKVSQSSSVTDGTNTYDFKMEMQPNLLMSIDSSSIIVPIELTTAIILPMLNIGAGIGADLNFGDTNLDLKAKSDLKLTGTGLPSTTNRGNVTATAKIKSQGAPIVSPKIMCGASIGFGPVKIDVPFTYYFTDPGFTVGLTAGIIF